MRWASGIPLGLLSFAWSAMLVSIWTMHLSRADQTGIWAIGLVFALAWGVRRAQTHRLARQLEKTQQALAAEAMRAARLEEFIAGPRYPLQ